MREAFRITFDTINWLVMVRYKRQKLKVLKFLDSNHRDEPFYASYVASEVKMNIMGVARMMHVLRSNGMVKVTIVKKKRGGKLYLYRLTDEFNVARAQLIKSNESSSR